MSFFRYFASYAKAHTPKVIAGYIIYKYNKGAYKGKKLN